MGFSLGFDQQQNNGVFPWAKNPHGNTMTRALPRDTQSRQYDARGSNSALSPSTGSEYPEQEDTSKNEPKRKQYVVAKHVFILDEHEMAPQGATDEARYCGPEGTKQLGA